jgi:hypothetical protein
MHIFFKACRITTENSRSCPAPISESPSVKIGAGHEIAWSKATNAINKKPTRLFEMGGWQLPQARSPIFRPKG